MYANCTMMVRMRGAASCMVHGGGSQRVLIVVVCTSKVFLEVSALCNLLNTVTVLLNLQTQVQRMHTDRTSFASSPTSLRHHSSLTKTGYSMISQPTNTSRTYFRTK